nr:pentatricopeptide repeat-containing protein At5g39350 [Aegilops tauschii subsp. strangulata]
MNPRYKALPKSFGTRSFLRKSNQTLVKSFASSAPAPSSAPPHTDALAELVHATRSAKCLRRLHALLAVTGAINRDTSAVTAAVEGYLSLGMPGAAASLFAGSHRRRPTVYSLNLAVRCFSAHGFHRELLGLYRTACAYGGGSDNFTFPPVIKACTAVGCLLLGREAHGRVLRDGHGDNVGVQTALLDMYAKAGWVGASRAVFDCMAQRDLISWNALISGYSLNGCFREAVEAMREMQEDGMRPNASTFVAAVGVCGAVGDSDAGDSLHAFALKCGALADESVTPAFISMYAGFDDLSSSRLLFDLQPVKDLVSYNSMISAYMQHDKWKESFEVFRLMRCAGLGPNLVTVVSVLPTCSDFFGVHVGESVHGMVIKFGLAEQISVVSALVSMYSKLGELDSAVQLFCSCTAKNHLLWNSIISGYILNNEWHTALDAFCRMQTEGVAADATTVIKVISGCRHIKDLRMAKSIHGYAVRNSFELNQSVMNALLAMYGDCGELSNSYKLFQKMEVPMLISWNTIISGYAEAGDAEASVRLFRQMRQADLQFDVVTLIGLTSSISVAEDATIGESLHSLAVKSGCSTDVSLTHTLITMYSNCGSVQACQRLFDSLSSVNTVSYNVLMTGYRKNNLSEEILPLFYEMVKNEKEPNHITLLNVLPVCQSQLQGKSVHGYAVRNFFRLETPMLTSAICMYSRFNNFDYSCKLFNSVGEKNTIVWNCILSACVQCKLADIAFDFFRQMCFLNVNPDAVTMLALISACSQIGKADLAECVTALLLKNGFGGSLFVVNALIDMHSRCGSISFARELFDSSGAKDSVTWSAMINSYGLHGDGKSAIDLFSMMIASGVEPDDVTFVSILSACSHSGLVEQARSLFKSLQIDYGITPRMEHYACMVDLLGRTGHLDEAYDVVGSMPFRPSESLLESLLGACRFHGNSKIGEAVGKLLIDSDHSNPRSYVMLSNIYASVGKWNDYEWLRLDMEGKGLRKDVGISLIE